MKKAFYFILWVFLLPVILATSKSGARFEFCAGVNSLKY